MSESGSSESHPAEHQPNAAEAQMTGGCTGGSCSSSSGESTPQAEITFVPATAETPVLTPLPVIAPITAEVVHAAATPTGCCSSEASLPVTGHASVTESAPAPVAAQVEAAPAPTAAATAVAEAPKAPTLTDAAANDLAAALATAQRARSRAKSNSRGPRPSDLIEKKIVIRRDRWDALIQLTETLRSERAVKAEPSEVAAIVLEAGLGAIIEESKAKPVAEPVKAAAPKAPAPKVPAAKAKVVAKAPVKSGLVKTLKKGKAKAKAAPKPTRAAAAKPRVFAEDEIDSLKKLVRGLHSDRSVQRTCALWLGAHPVKGGLAVPIEDLRSLCKTFKVYDTANFAQNMKKDAAFFT